MPWISSPSLTLMVDPIDGKRRHESKFLTPVTLTAPVLICTDILDGPTSGGQGNLGAYMRLYVAGIGAETELGTLTRVYIGGEEVGEYIMQRRTKAQPTGGYLMTWEIAVRVGRLNGAAYGTPLAVTVEYDSVASNSNNTFTPVDSDILYVDYTNGNDTTAEKGDITKPWKHIQRCSVADTWGLEENCAWWQAQNGDQIIVMPGSYYSADSNYKNIWLHARHAPADTAHAGSAPSSTAGTGYLKICGYPSATEWPTVWVGTGDPDGARYGPTLDQVWDDSYGYQDGDGRGGVVGRSTTLAWEGSDFFVLSGIEFECSLIPEAGTGLNPGTHEGPINLKNEAYYWRVIGNWVHDWVSANAEARSGGIAGNCYKSVYAFNRIDGIAGVQRNHGIYLDFDAGAGEGPVSHVEIAWNHITNITGGNLIQLYGANNTDTLNINMVAIHHNLLGNGIRYGINVGSGAWSNIYAWNNIVLDTQLAWLRFDNSHIHTSYFEHNLAYNVGIAGSAYESETHNYEHLDVSSNPLPKTIIRRNICYLSETGSGWTGGSVGFPIGDTGYEFDDNSWVFLGDGAAPTDYPGTEAPAGWQLEDPLIVGVSISDYRLSAASPLLERVAVSAWTVTVGNDDKTLSLDTDFYLQPRPESSAVGPCEVTQ